MSSAKSRLPGFLVVGMATIDTFLELDGSHGGNESVAVVRSSARRHGGKGYLVANAIRQTTQTEVILVSEVAARGSEFLSGNVRSPGLLPTIDHDSLVWIVTGTDGDQRTYVKQGRRCAGVPDLQHHIRSFLTNQAWVYVSAERADILRAFVAVHRAAKPDPPVLAVNPCVPLQDILADDADSLRYLVANADIMVLNEDESLRLRASVPDATPKRSTVVVVTDGAAGGRYSTDAGRRWSSFAAELVSDGGLSAAGAGDMFNGCLVAHLADRMPVRESIGHASAAAAAYVRELRRALR